MLKPLVFANSLAFTIIIFRILAIILSLLIPNFFEFSIRSLSLGLISNYQDPKFSDLLISILVPSAAGWALAYAWATIYNKWSNFETIGNTKGTLTPTPTKRSRKKRS